MVKEIKIIKSEPMPAEEEKLESEDNATANPSPDPSPPPSSPSNKSPSPPPPPPPAKNLTEQLCASCDPCRARKTKCDGRTPCQACITKYVRRAKVPEESVTAEQCGCCYSVAKRRGPQPGYKNERARKREDGALHNFPKKKRSKEMRMEQYQRSLSNRYHYPPPPPHHHYQQHLNNNNHQYSNNNRNSMGGNDGNGAMLGGNNIPLPLDPGAAALQQQILSGLGAIGLGICANFAGGMPSLKLNQGGDAMAAASNSAQQQLGFIEQLQRQQQELQQQHRQNQDQMNKMNQNIMQISPTGPAPPISKRGSEESTFTLPSANNTPGSAVGCEKTTVLELLPFLLSTHSMGLRFRASFTLSFGSMFQLPPILTCEGYYRQLKPNGAIPKYDVAALQAAQFAELAIGAFVDGERYMMFKLINASILCLQDCVKEPVHRRCQLELARAFFYHSVLRCYNTDMERCFKYRRAALNALAKLDGLTHVDTLIAAISLQDTLAFMLYNGCEDDVPDIDCEYPQVTIEQCGGDSTGPQEASKLCSDPKNKSWINCPLGFTSVSSPSVQLMNALACATRYFVYESLIKKDVIDDSTTETNEKFKLCLGSLSVAQGFLTEETDKSFIRISSTGHRLLLKALQVVTYSGTSELEAQVPNAFEVLKTVIQQPLLLFQGPIHLFFHKCVLYIAQVINKLHKEGINDESAQAMFDEALDLCNASRVLSNMHNAKIRGEFKLPLIPSPNFKPASKSDTFIDLSEVTESISFDHTAGKLSASAPDIEKECTINDKAFLVFLSGTFLGLF